jgi:hypothetical protein
MKKKLVGFLVFCVLLASALYALSGVSVAEFGANDKSKGWFGSTIEIRVKIRNDNNYPVTVMVQNLPGGNDGMEPFSDPVTIRANSTSGWIDVPSPFYTGVRTHHFRIVEAN